MRTLYTNFHGMRKTTTDLCSIFSVSVDRDVEKVNLLRFKKSESKKQFWTEYKM